MVLEGNKILWGPIFRRDLTEEAEERDLFSLLGILENIFLLGEGMDERVWIPLKDGTYSVASFFSVLAEEGQSKGHLGHIWKLRISPRIAVFGWLAIRGSILMMDNLRR